MLVSKPLFLSAALCVVLSPTMVRASTPIYRCTIGGVTTFSDRLCSADAQAWEPDVSRISTYAPPPAAAESQRTTRKAPATKRTTRAASAASQAKHTAACDRIKASLREIRSKQRAGYSAKEGERLKVRQTKLESSRRVQRC